ncbi:MAG: hypothetical protein WAN20_10740 [Pseudonocardiaceae bacterium]
MVEATAAGTGVAIIFQSRTRYLAIPGTDTPDKPILLRDVPI